MQSSEDRHKLLAAYSAVGSSSKGTVVRCAAGLAVLFGVAAGTVSADHAEPSLIQTHVGAKARLSVEQPSIAHAREVYATRRAAHQPNPDVTATR